MTWDQLVDGGVFGAGRVPLLVVHDENDREVAPHHADRIRSAWGGPVTSYATRELGHRRILRDAEVVQRVVRFVQGECPDHALGERVAA